MISLLTCISAVWPGLSTCDWASSGLALRPSRRTATVIPDFSKKFHSGYSSFFLQSFPNVDVREIKPEFQNGTAKTRAGSRVGEQSLHPICRTHNRFLA